MKLMKLHQCLGVSDVSLRFQGAFARKHLSLSGPQIVPLLCPSYRWTISGSARALAWLRAGASHPWGGRPLSPNVARNTLQIKMLEGKVHSIPWFLFLIKEFNVFVSLWINFGSNDMQNTRAKVAFDSRISQDASCNAMSCVDLGAQGPLFPYKSVNCISQFASEIVICKCFFPKAAIDLDTPVVTKLCLEGTLEFCESALLHGSRVTCDMLRANSENGELWHHSLQR